MEYTHRYHAYSTEVVARELDRHIDIRQQAYNYARYEYENVDTDAIGSAYSLIIGFLTGKTSSPCSRR